MPTIAMTISVEACAGIAQMMRRATVSRSRSSMFRRDHDQVDRGSARLRRRSW